MPAGHVVPGQHTFFKTTHGTAEFGKRTTERIEVAFQIAGRQLRRIQTCVVDRRYGLLKSIIGAHRLRTLHRTCILYTLAYLIVLTALWIKAYHFSQTKGTYKFKTSTCYAVPAVGLLVVIKHVIQLPLGLGTIPLMFRWMASVYLSASIVGTLVIFAFVSSADAHDENDLLFEFMALALSIFTLLTNSLRWEFHKYARCCEWILERDYGIERVMLSDVITINRSMIAQINACIPLLPQPLEPQCFARCQRGFLCTEVIDVTNHLHSMSFRKRVTPVMLKRKSSIMRTYATYAGGSMLNLHNMPRDSPGLKTAFDDEKDRLM